MFRLEFKNGLGGSTEDWTNYVSSLSPIKRRVESENPGEAGLIVFDKLSCEFEYEGTNLPKQAFDTDLDNADMYLFKVIGIKSDDTEKQLFEGVVDLKSVERPNLSNKIKFNVLDKLSAISLLENDILRVEDTRTFTAGVGDDHKFIKIVHETIGGKSILRLMDVENDPELGDIPQPIANKYLVPGDILHIPPKSGATEVKYALVVKSKIITIPYDALEIEILLEGNNYDPGEVLIASNEDIDTLTFYTKEFAGIDIGIYSGTGDNRELTSFDATKIAEAIIKIKWTGITVNRIGLTEFPAPLNYYIDLITESPFRQHPIDALTMLADSMQCYIYTNSAGEIDIYKKTSLGTIGSPVTFNENFKKDSNHKHFWNKTVDQVEIIVNSWVKSETGDYLQGTYILSKNPNIKARNPLTKELLCLDADADTQEELDILAQSYAQDYFDFYGKRHEGDPHLFKLYDDVYDWDLLSYTNRLSKDWWFESLQIDLLGNKAKVELVSVTGYNYDSSTAHIPKNKDSQSRSPFSKDTTVISSGGATLNSVLTALSQLNTTPGILVQTGAAQFTKRNVVGVAGEIVVTNGNGVDGNITIGIDEAFLPNIIFNYPLSLSGNEVDLLCTGNFKLTSNQLDTIQNIKITSAVQFGSMGLGGAPSTEKLKVYGDTNVTGNLAVGADINVTGLISNVDSIRNYININCDGNTAGAVGGGIKLLGTSGALIADIIYNGTEWAFNKPLDVDGTVTLSQATTTSHALRASRTLQITGTTNRVIVDNSSARNLTNDLSWNLTLPQDFHTSAVVQLARVGLGVAAESGYSLKATLPIKLTSGNTSLITGGLQHPSYQSQTSNWRLTSNGQLDVRYLYTDELHARTFIADLEQALVGSEIITKSVAKLLSDFTIPAAGGSATLYIESMPGFETAAMFQDGDIIRLRQWDRTGGSLSIANVWGTVVLLDYNDTNEPPYQRYTFTRSTGGRAGSATAGTTIKKGTLALDYGQGSGGYYEINAIDGLNGSNSPYAQAVIWRDHPADGLFVKSRVGNISGTSSSVYGAHKGFGGSFERMYATGAVAIAGSLSAGDSSGFDHTFLAGKLNKNLVDNSRNIHLSSQWWGSLATVANVDQEVDTVPNPVGQNKYVATISTLAGDGSENGYAFWFKGGMGAGHYSASLWVKKAEIGTNSEFRVVLRIHDGSQYHELDEFYSSVTDNWKRISVSGYAKVSGELSVIIFPRYNASTPKRGKVYIYGLQVEDEELATNYIPTDGNANLTNYGMWSVYGGFGGVPQAPVIELDGSGFVLKARSAYAKALGNNEIRIGHITGTAANAIKITDTGTASTSGIFVYDSSSQEVIGLKRSGEHNLSGFKIEYNKLSNQGLRLEAGGESTFTGLGVNDGTRDRLKIGHNAGDLDKSGLEVSRISVTLSNYNFGVGSGGWTIGSGDYTYKPEIVVSNQVYNGVGNLNLGSNALVIKGGQRTTSETAYQNTAQQALLGGSTILSNQKAILKMDIRVVEYLNADMDYRLRVIISADGTKYDIDAEIDLSTISRSGYTTVYLSMDCESPHNTSGYIRFEASALKKTADAESHIYNAIAIDNIDILTYTNTSITHISDGDVEFYYNPFNNIRFNSGGVYMNMDKILFNGVAMGRYRGAFYNSMPPKDNRAGDYGFLLDTSTQKVAFYVPQRGWKLASLT